MGIAVLAFLVLGCGFRVVRYAQNLPLWADECLLAVNFIGRGYLELLEPLDNGQIAPPLFLWIQRLVLNLSGFSEATLRLFPLLCGLASMFVFWRLARDAFPSQPRSVLLTVAIFAVSVHPIRHAAEAKPYASDLLVAVLLLALTVNWLRRPQQARWLWALCLLTPIGLALSNPATFVAGGVAAGLLLVIVRTGTGAVWIPYGCFLGAILVTSAILHGNFSMAQSAAAFEGLRQYWASSFPPLTNPPALCSWLISAHTGSCFAYPGGGSGGASTGTLLAFVVGAAVMIRHGDRPLAACLLAPFALAFLAAALRLYPYGGEARLMQFAAPSICLLTGHGAAALVGRLSPPNRRPWVTGGFLTALIGCGIAPQVVSFRVPYRMLCDLQSREFAQRFWSEQSRNAEVQCAHIDHGIDPSGVWQGRKAWYLCNQVIYSPARRPFAGRDQQDLSAEHPLRCVVYGHSADSLAVRDWLSRMPSHLMLRETHVHQIELKIGDGDPVTDQLLVFEFVPSRDRLMERTARGQDSLRRFH
jgi:hypothetical protein